MLLKLIGVIFMYDSGFLRNSDTGKVVKFKSIDSALISLNFADDDESLIFSILDSESDLYSNDKINKDIYFDSLGKRLFIYDKGFNAWENLDNLVYISNDDATDDFLNFVSGEVFIIHFDGYRSIDGSDLYSNLKSIIVDAYESDVDIVFIRHTLTDGDLLEADLSRAEIVFSKELDDYKKMYYRYLKPDGLVEPSIIDMLYKYREISEGFKGLKIDDYINLNFMVKSISTSSSCNVVNLFISD